MDCPFCAIIAKRTERLISETAHTFTTLSNPRLMPGHLLVIPKRHVEKLSQLSGEERNDLIDQAMRLQEKVLESVAPGCDISQHYRPFIPNGRLKVAHLHIHVRPRSLDDELYTKVQIFENDLFQEPSPEEYEKYRKLFSED
jgi:histidine triad (HIT) family protein